MSRPLLQLALDHTNLQAAQRDVALLQESVDIVEAGTILCLTEGLGAVKALRAQCPNKIIVADWKVADAGETLAQQAFGAGANWMTIICAAPLATVEKGHSVAQSCGGEIQMELFGNWTWMMPATGIASGFARRFITVDAMRRPAVNSGGSRSGADEGAFRYWSGAVDYRWYYARRPAAVSRHQRQSLYRRTRAGGSTKPGAGGRRIPCANRRHLGSTVCVTIR